MKRITYDTWEAYLAAWEYCMTVGMEFSYSRKDFFIESTDFNEEDLECLELILSQEKERA